MGWLWASPSPQKPSTPVQNQSSTAQAQTAAPNEPVDPEIQKFYDLFKGDNSSSSTTKTTQISSSTQNTSSSTQQTTSSSPTTSETSWLSLRRSKAEPVPEAPILSPITESLLPTEMSCRQAFDQAWACNGFGGQWNSVYRYGSMRSCSEQWDDFWFCMRTKSQTGKVKEDLVRARYREKEWRKYGPGKPSSEDIWESRERKVEPGTAFTEKIDI